MSDPAEAAAQRAADVFAGWIPPFEYDDALDGARQALKPIREVLDRWHEESVHHPETWQLMDEIGELVFPTEETVCADT